MENTNSSYLEQGTSVPKPQNDFVQSAAAVESEASDPIEAFLKDAPADFLDDKQHASRLNALLREQGYAEKALDALAPLCQAGDVIEVRAISPGGGGCQSACGRLDDPEERQALVAFIEANNGRRNLHPGVNPRRAELAGTQSAAKNEDIVARNAVFLDLDGHQAPDNDPGWTRTLSELRTHNPQMVVQSGNGYHVWFALEPQATAEALATSSAAVKEAMARIGADDMSDLARVARLPFTVNIPSPAKRRRGAVPRMAMPIFQASTQPARQSPAAFRDAMADIASRLQLPDRQNSGALASRIANTGTSAGAMTGWPAPSLEAFRMLFDELPNDGPFDFREDWVVIAHAAKCAAVKAGIEPEAREIWLDWCAKWGGGDPMEDARVWDTCTKPRAGWGTLVQILEATNNGGAARLSFAIARANAVANYDETMKRLAALSLTPVPPFVPSQIPPRRFLYGRHVIQRFISMLVAPGGTGKSALLMTEAVAMASGRELLPGDKPVRSLRVWYHNAEDDADEMQRRLAAALDCHGLSHADLQDNLILTGRDLGADMTLARLVKDGPEIIPGIVEGLADIISSAGIDVLVLDPLGAMHTLPENSNEAANLLMKALRELADAADVAIVLVHHTSKAAAMDMSAAGAGASRGASAFTDAARHVRQLTRMSTKEATQFGISEDQRNHYIRIDNGKANLAPAEHAHWLHMVSVNLGNGASYWPNGDDVQAVERWTPPSLVNSLVDVQDIQRALGSSNTKFRRDARSTDWVGYLIAGVLGLDVGEQGQNALQRTNEQNAARGQVTQLLDAWLREGYLRVAECPDPRQGRARPMRYIEVGTPVDMQAADADLFPFEIEPQVSSNPAPVDAKALDLASKPTFRKAGPILSRDRQGGAMIMSFLSSNQPRRKSEVH